MMVITLFITIILQLTFSGVISDIAENSVCRLSGPVYALLCFVLTNPVIGFISLTAVILVAVQKLL